MDTRGQHLTADIWLREEITPELISRLTSIIDSHFTVVQRNYQFFYPQGETVVYILSESHFTCHTYPEHKYLSLDLYICNMHTDLYFILNKIKESMQIKDINSNVQQRGISQTSNIPPNIHFPF